MCFYSQEQEKATFLLFWSSTLFISKQSPTWLKARESCTWTPQSAPVSHSVWVELPLSVHSDRDPLSRNSRFGSGTFHILGFSSSINGKLAYNTVTYRQADIPRTNSGARFWRARGKNDEWSLRSEEVVQRSFSSDTVWVISSFTKNRKPQHWMALLCLLLGIKLIQSNLIHSSRCAKCQKTLMKWSTSVK